MRKGWLPEFSSFPGIFSSVLFALVYKYWRSYSSLKHVTVYLGGFICSIIVKTARPESLKQ